MSKKLFRAFTFAEVLVVIVIIMILASIMFSAGIGAKKSAVATVCVSNLHQLSLAMKLYQGDLGEYPPNSALLPSFRAYYPTVLTCPASKNKDRPNLRSVDYRMMGAPIAQGVQSPTALGAAFETCRRLRESSMPLALDFSHVTNTISDSNTTDFYLIAREDGRVERVMARAVYKLKGPCDSSILAQQYNY